MHPPMSGCCNIAISTLSRLRLELTSCARRLNGDVRERRFLLFVLAERTSQSRIAPFSALPIVDLVGIGVTDQPRDGDEAMFDASDLSGDAASPSEPRCSVRFDGDGTWSAWRGAILLASGLSSVTAAWDVLDREFARHRRAAEPKPEPISRSLEPISRPVHVRRHRSRRA